MSINDIKTINFFLIFKGFCDQIVFTLIQHNINIQLKLKFVLNHNNWKFHLLTHNCVHDFVSQINWAIEFTSSYCSLQKYVQLLKINLGPKEVF